MDEKSTVITPDNFKTGVSKNRGTAKSDKSGHKPKYRVELKKGGRGLTHNQRISSYVARNIRDKINLKEEESMVDNNTEQFEKRIEDKLNHQNDMNSQKYDHLSSSLSVQITNAIDRLETSQKNSVDRLKASQDNYFEKADLKTEKLLSDFREELRIERKKDRNTIVTWTLTGVSIIVAIAGFLIPMFI